MDDQKQQAAARIKEANNILVTVSSNPSVDQLAACIGTTIALNKMGKHATAVFSGEVPSTIEFLQPEKTLEKNTDSLRDFIIALDKSKADKLRYKVEDTVVKIFITPYKTSISDKDLEFSQGDFNVDVVLALGVHTQSELDQAITSHGRILHDATIVTMNIKPGGELGSINWLDPTSSSLSELTVQLVDLLDAQLLDTQIATAMLTGIVAETDRFSNSKTSPRTMTLSAELMTAGANQQLVATKLEVPAPPPPAPVAPADDSDSSAPTQADTPPMAMKADDGTLEITHDPKAEAAARESAEADAHSPEESAAEDAVQEPAPKETELRPESHAIHDVKSDVVSQASPTPVVNDKPAFTPAPSAHPPETITESTPVFTSEPDELSQEKTPPQIHIDEHGSLSLPGAPIDLPAISHHDQAPKGVSPVPPISIGESYDPSVNTFGATNMPASPQAPIMQSDASPPEDAAVAPSPDVPTVPQDSFSMPYEALESEPPVTNAFPSEDDKTLSEIEADVHSSHMQQTQPVPEPIIDESANSFSVPDLATPPVAPEVPPAPSLDTARDAVSRAAVTPAPVFGAPVGSSLPAPDSAFNLAPVPPTPVGGYAAQGVPSAQAMPVIPSALDYNPAPPYGSAPAPEIDDPSAPPQVPPPFMPTPPSQPPYSQPY